MLPLESFSHTLYFSSFLSLSSTLSTNHFKVCVYVRWRGGVRTYISSCIQVCCGDFIPGFISKVFYLSTRMPILLKHWIYWAVYWPMYVSMPRPSYMQLFLSVSVSPIINLYVYVSACRSVCLPVCVCLSISLSVYLFVCLSACVRVCFSLYLSDCHSVLTMRMFFCLSVSLSLCFFVSLSLSLSICFSISLSLLLCLSVWLVALPVVFSLSTCMYVFLLVLFICRCQCCGMHSGEEGTAKIKPGAHGKNDFYK